jgi:hypothetical protein
MSLAAEISAVKIRPFIPAARATWSEVRAEELSASDSVLLRTEASIFQYPFWNEPYRRLGLTPRYLAWRTPRRPIASATILTLGFGPAKIGLVFRGPTLLMPGTEIPGAMLSDLLLWAREQGYMFLRFTHSDPEVLTGLAAAGGYALRGDIFPYMLDYSITSGDYVVEQCESDEETLASFDREVRRKLRRADEEGYEFGWDDSPEALEQVWPLYEECARRKQFRVERPLFFYKELMQRARGNQLARLYLVRLHGKIVGSTLVFRDRRTAHCQLAAFDPDHRQSATFLHWRSMRDMYRMGAERYNLGPGPGSLARFKSMFARRPVQYPSPLTVVLKENWFRLWRRTFIPAAKQLHPMIRTLALYRAALSGRLA